MSIKLIEMNMTVLNNQHAPLPVTPGHTEYTISIEDMNNMNNVNELNRHKLIDRMETIFTNRESVNMMYTHGVVTGFIVGVASIVGLISYLNRII
jgi:hypothetical protein